MTSSASAPNPLDPSNPSKTPPAPRLASTILLLRDRTDAGPGEPELEMFMVERNHKIDFAEGALVYPGGKIEESDHDPKLLPYCRGDEEKVDALRVAAIRETFEECGVLLARPRGSEALVDAERLRRISANFSRELKEQSIRMLDVVQQEDLELAFDRLIPFAHWITPEFMPKRFDTHFFLVEAPADHLAVHDGSESVDSLWTTVPNALELEKSGRRTIIFPTLENVKKLGRCDSVAEALATARADQIITVLPKITKDPDGTLMMELPPEAGYETVRAPVSALMGNSPKKNAAPSEKKDA